MLNNDCSGMQRYNDYCVGIPGKHSQVEAQLEIDETNLTRFHADD